MSIRKEENIVKYNGIIFSNKNIHNGSESQNTGKQKRLTTRVHTMFPFICSRKQKKDWSIRKKQIISVVTYSWGKVEGWWGNLQGDRNILLLVWGWYLHPTVNTSNKTLKIWAFYCILIKTQMFFKRLGCLTLGSWYRTQKYQQTP